ncbi:hypothetical protein SAMN05216515_12122 [Eubacterium pyruvativorans]|uniref:Uncharacterized protein n=2 Tax=Eubacterium pyruvativorans TaxID=155865 RepID=A0A1I7HN62_9FIRM|nr:hypothetical protein SAMN05216515_12122 [Eubacterium pyruvativorans]SFU62103.1 hypothetical protein SAMN05216508_12022 [Eubacterium pyruvativorans]
MSMKAVKVIDIICIVIFVLMGVYIFALPNAAQDFLLPVFTIINPYKTGAWIIGIGFLVTCLWGKGKAGLVLGVVLLVCYLITAFVSLVGLMVVTTGLDLLWYLHPILVVIGCIVAIRRKRRR